MTTGAGFTTTETVCVLEQPVEVLVMVYTYPTVTGEVVVFTNVSLIFPVLVTLALLIPGTVTLLHANVELGKALAAAVYEKAAPLQVEAFNKLLKTGTGLTSTVTV